jgi:hypothetical protein
LSEGISAFLSASADQADRKIVDWFSNLLKEYKIEPIFAADRPEPRPPPEKIENFIHKSDLFIAIVTKRDPVKGKENAWRGPAWVQNEIAMAYALKKPIAVFVEKQVQLDPSIATFITDCVSFDRRDLESIRDIAKSFIEALQKRAQALRKEVSSYTSTMPKNEAVDETIVEDVEEGAFESVITRTGRAILLRRYGKLNVSLKAFYFFSIIAIAILSYIGYDSLYGTRALGPLGGGIAIAIVIVLVVISSVAEGSRCKKCKSYFSRVEAPVTYGDIKKFPNLPKEKIIVKHVCKICGDISYSTRDREE